MSLNSQKAKQATGKQKGQPKLKIILANPYKPRSLSLADHEVIQLKQLIRSDIEGSGMEPTSYATSRRIHLGLQSSLRAINNKEMSCVMVSLRIKPRYIINQITYLVEAKNPSVPVYCIPNLQDITEEIFGVRSLSVVLPKSISPLLDEWTNDKKKPIAIKKKQPVVVKKRTTKQLPQEAITKQAALKPKIADNHIQKIDTKTKEKSCTMDYISFSGSKDTKVDALDYEEDKQRLIRALENVTTKVTELSQKKTTASATVAAAAEALSDHKEKEDTSSDADDFLGDYKALTVHKIRPNPNKKPKKKRKNKKNLKLK